MTDSDFIWRFTPSRTDPELLEAIFVQREPLLVDLLERVAESATTASKHHVLLIGPRGFGKTHLITLLNHRLSKDVAMSDRIRVAWLLEDETITSFVQLLKRIYEVLAQQYPAEFPLDWLQDLLTESPKRIRQQLEAKLVESFANRTLLLCIENLDFLFSGLGTSGQHDWRAFLQEHPFTTIIASTQRLFADVKSRDKPFFGFFTPVPLEPLTVNDAVELLRRVAANRKATDLVTFLDSAEGRSRVRALHHLAGGNHRIYVVLSGFISRDSLDELVGPFQKMADDLTPYYQERLRWLSPQQRQIIEYLCSQDYSCVPKQIARQLLATESTISGQLKKLLEIGYVLRSEAGRESRYELAEPLMRLASEVKEQQRRPLQLLVNFLRVWYRPETLPELMDRAGTDSLRRHIAAAIEDAEAHPDPRIRIRDIAIEKAFAEEKTGNHVEGLAQLRATRVAYDGLIHRNDPSMIECLFPAFAVCEVETVRQLADACADFYGITLFGSRLVRSLAVIDPENTTHRFLLRWRDFWTDWGKNHAEMQVPLRIFGVGIDYLIKQDKKVLLDLVQTEREILSQALAIET